MSIDPARSTKTADGSSPAKVTQNQRQFICTADLQLKWKALYVIFKRKMLSIETILNELKWKLYVVMKTLVVRTNTHPLLC